MEAAFVDCQVGYVICHVCHVFLAWCASYTYAVPAGSQHSLPVFCLPLPPDGSTASSSMLLSHIAWPCSIRQALTYHVDLTGVPRKSLLRLLAEHCSDEAEKRTLMYLSSRSGAAMAVQVYELVLG